MTNPHLNATHRLIVLRKLEALTPRPATNSAPKFIPPSDPVRDLRQAGVNLDRTLVEARKLIGSLKTSPTPAATLRKVETIARSAAADLSAARRSAAITAEQFKASTARPTMNRSEFDKLIHRERNAFIRSGGKLSD
jgi:hypothetical protein